LLPATPQWEEHLRYQTELVPQVAMVLKLPAATTAALVELDRRLAVEQEKLRPPGTSLEPAPVTQGFVELQTAYEHAKVRVLGGAEAANRFEKALSAAYNGTLSVLPEAPTKVDPGDPFTIVLGDPGYRHDAANRYDPIFAAVR
jgi:hypothetical protein